MTWVQVSHGFRLNPPAVRSPEALVVLLSGFGAFAATLTPVASRWATTVPTTAFVALDGIEQFDQPSRRLPSHTMLDLDDSAEPTMLDRPTRHLESLIERQLRSCRLDASRLVLVGFGHGGTLALHMVLGQGWSCAGVLAFSARLMRPLPRIRRVDHKVRLIECVRDRHIGHGSLRADVALLTARGIDTRGVLLAGSALSDEAIRHGGAYLVELVATAQRGNRFHVERESRHVRSSATTKIGAELARDNTDPMEDIGGRQP
jgi:predicted esterase